MLVTTIVPCTAPEKALLKIMLEPIPGVEFVVGVMHKEAVELVGQMVATGVIPPTLFEVGLIPTAGVVAVAVPWERNKNSRPPATLASTRRHTAAIMIQRAVVPRLTFGAGETGYCRG